MSSPADRHDLSRHHHDHDCGCGHDHDLESHDAVAFGESAMQAYYGYGVHFSYPRDWIVTEESGPDQTTITVQSPGTSYWTISLFQDRPDPEAIIDSVIEAYSSEYEDVDVYQLESHRVGFPVICRELDFVCLDSVTSVGMLAFQAIDQSILVMFQGEDRELESTRPLLESITQTALAEMVGEDDALIDDESDE